MKKNKEHNFDEILAKESPKLLLELKKHQTTPRLPAPLFSAPLKLLTLISVIDIAAGILLSIIHNRSYFQNWGSFIAIGIPWWLAFLDGFIFLIYGIYVMKKKEGDLDIGPFPGSLEVRQVEGSAASLLGLVYIFLSIFLIAAVVVRLFTQGIF